MSDFRKYIKILNSMMAIGSRFIEHSGKAFYYGTEVMIYSSEIHLIEQIGLNNRLNVTELAENLQVTKGAVSQVIKRLEQKKLVYKTAGESDRKQIFLQLTDAGKTAYLNHENHHRKQYFYISEYLEGKSEKEVHLIQEFLGKVKDSFEI